MHADAEGKLSQDRKQNCDHFYLDMKGQSIVFERYFDTCDDDDYVIEVSINHLSKSPQLSVTNVIEFFFTRMALFTSYGLMVLTSCFRLKVYA